MRASTTCAGKRWFRSTNMRNPPSVDLYNAVQRLEPKLRTVVILRFFEDMKLEDIASITGDPLSTVKSRLYKALKLLKVDLQEGVMAT